MKTLEFKRKINLSIYPILCGLLTITSCSTISQSISESVTPRPERIRQINTYYSDVRWKENRISEEFQNLFHSNLEIESISSGTRQTSASAWFASSSATVKDYFIGYKLKLNTSSNIKLLENTRYKVGFSIRAVVKSNNSGDLFGMPQNTSSSEGGTSSSCSETEYVILENIHDVASGRVMVPVVIAGSKHQLGIHQTTTVTMGEPDFKLSPTSIEALE